MEELHPPAQEITITERNANPTLYHDLIECKVKMWKAVLVRSQIFSAVLEVFYLELVRTQVELQHRAMMLPMQKITVIGAKTPMRQL